LKWLWTVPWTEAEISGVPSSFRIAPSDPLRRRKMAVVSSKPVVEPAATYLDDRRCRSKARGWRPIGFASLSLYLLLYELACEGWAHRRENARLQWFSVRSFVNCQEDRGPQPTKQDGHTRSGTAEPGVIAVRACFAGLYARKRYSTNEHRARCPPPSRPEGAVGGPFWYWKTRSRSPAATPTASSIALFSRELLQGLALGKGKYPEAGRDQDYLDHVADRVDRTARSPSGPWSPAAGKFTRRPTAGW